MRTLGTIALGCCICMLSVGKAGACCAVAENGTPVVNADQTVILWWDRANQTEHFIRRASFRGGGDSVGFLVPSPSRPQLEESGDDAFPYLAKLTRPAPSGGGFPLGCSVASPIARNEVRVIEEKSVAGYNAVVLTAGSGDALLKWLASNSYAFGPETAAWAEPYVKNGWYISAMKIPKSKGTGEKPTTASALRITFKTDKPLFPYREPDSRSDASRLGMKNRLLRIYFVGDVSYEGHFSTGQSWPAAVRYGSPLKESERSRLIQLLGLPSSAGPSKAWLTEFEHPWPYGIAPGDVYFKPSLESNPGRHASAGLAGDPALMIIVGWWVLPVFRRISARMTRQDEND